MKYIKSLDGFRALAVLLVIFDHWDLHGAFHLVPYGPLGVTLFYVLSGFLITSLLLKSKEELLVTTVGANHPDDALALDDFAVFAKFFD